MNRMDSLPDDGFFANEYIEGMKQAIPDKGEKPDLGTVSPEHFNND